MPYADPEKRRQVKRESARRARANARVPSAPAAASDLPEPPDRAELLRILGVQARQGHVVAIRTLLEEYRRDGDSNEKPRRSTIDELAARRTG